MPRPQPRILMCPPDFYGIEYEINPWMDVTRGADRAEAARQWQWLHALLGKLGAEIFLVPPVPGLPDMVFTANAGLIYRDLFVSARFRHTQRQSEAEHFENWALAQGLNPVCLRSPWPFEGAGDALFCGESLFAGYLHRSVIQAHHQLAVLLGCQVLSLELVDPRFYHLDTCFCPLAPGVALYFPAAFDEYAQRVLREHVPTLLEVTEPDAQKFGCNAVVIGKRVVHNSNCDTMSEMLRHHGFEPHPTPLGEFLKAGGSAKCLTLRLDGEEAAPW